MMTLADAFDAKTVWVVLGEDDMYGAEMGTDNVVECRVRSVNANYGDLNVEDVDSEDEFDGIEPEQVFATEAKARASCEPATDTQNKEDKGHG